MVNKRNHPKMAELFRLVNYYNLPRLCVLCTHFFLNFCGHRDSSTSQTQPCHWVLASRIQSNAYKSWIQKKTTMSKMLRNHISTPILQLQNVGAKCVFSTWLSQARAKLKEAVGTSGPALWILWMRFAAKLQGLSRDHTMMDTTTHL